MTLGEQIAAARPRVIAALAVQLRDLDLAEDAFAESAAKALQLPDPPERVAGWLFVAAKRKAVDMIRKREAEGRAIADAEPLSDMADIIQLPEPIEDERLRLIFICCHPALALEVRTALALKVICGLPVDVIARLFVTSRATMFQRITRAKRKVQEAGISFELPPRKAWGERLDAVLLTLELAYTAAYQDAAGELDAELSEEVARLAAMVAELLPDEPEVLGLAALVWLAASREKARIDKHGAMVPLSRQDCALWNYAAIDQARRWLDRAQGFGRTGPYQVMAAIQLTHARRGFDGATDWRAIVKLYNALAIMRPGAMVSLNRALALAKVEGAQAGLDALQSIAGDRVENSRPFQVARADLLADLGRLDEAKAAFARALALNPPRAERLFLESKLAALWAL